MLTLPLAHLVANFVLDGKKYEIEQFRISFVQPTDYKGQPQHEIMGGQILIKITQIPDDNLYLWAKKAIQLKSGQVLFQTDLGITVLKINFTNAYCISLTREINAYNGTSTSLIISPENVSMNGVEHDNFWPK
ncbi:MAG: type VI secretion system needle protein Hcp [Tannerella sp.]|jgi:hypothetical protein|nr:type VI secretion system needle protein Hcp [Tannerella sp.]